MNIGNLLDYRKWHCLTERVVLQRIFQHEME